MSELYFDWAMLEDGRMHQLQLGREFSCSTRMMRALAMTEGRRRGFDPVAVAADKFVVEVQWLPKLPPAKPS